jgi:Zn-dependent protease
VLGFVAFLVATLALAPAILIAVPAHELGHAVAAYFIGDKSVRYFGHLSYNPRRQLDVVGVIAVLVALVGWGRRVPVQANRINTVGRRVLYELGGPAANLLVALLLGLVLRTLFAAGVSLSVSFSVGLVALFVYAIWFLNLSIMAFQLLPIPGLDGWNIVEALFRDRNPRLFFNVSVRKREIWFGCVIILFLFQLFQGASLLSIVMSPFYAPASLISLGHCSGYAIPGFNGLDPCLPWVR